ncbi:MAG: hypothetical protein ACRYF5_00820 [Janthinobacterium lividum]
MKIAATPGFARMRWNAHAALETAARGGSRRACLLHGLDGTSATNPVTKQLCIEDKTAEFIPSSVWQARLNTP